MEKRSSDKYPAEVESPFLNQEFFVAESDEEWEPRLVALQSGSPFQRAFDQDRTTSVEPELEEEFVGEEEWSDESDFSGDEADVRDEEALSDFQDEEDVSYYEGEVEAFPEEAAALEEEPLVSEQDWIESEGEEDAYPLQEAYGEEGSELDEESFIEPEEERVDWWTPESEIGPAIPAGREELTKVPLLRRHRGTGPDLILSWNDMAAQPPSVDVAVHLHGYSLRSGKPLNTARDIVPRSGLDWADPEGQDSGPNRLRPTLALLPRGHFFGGKSNRGYSFPALVTEAGLRQLIEFGLDHFARHIGATRVPLRRLILTAHSGGGAALLRILQHNDPHEVQIFDGLYQDPAELIRWAKDRIERDRKALESSAESVERYMLEQGGSLRVQFRPGSATQRYSLIVHDALTTAIPSGSALNRWYRVEQTSLGHLLIPRHYGWRLIANAAAELPGASAPRGVKTAELYFEEEALTKVVFPSGESLPVLSGFPDGKEQDYWDPTGSGNPLLDTGPAHKDKKLSADFTVRELTTSGGVSADVARIDPKLVESLQRLRDHVGKSVRITSGYRSWKRNKQVYAGRKNPDGTPKKPTLSQHCGGRAADINIAGMNGLEIGKAAIDACGPSIGVGLGNTFAHIDVRGYAAAWNYGGVKRPWIAEVKRYQQAKGGASRPPAGGVAKPSQQGTAKPAAELVRFAQRVLNAAEGEQLDDDGDLGRLTREALERFRKKYNFGTGGVLDAKTELALAQRALEEIAQQSLFAQPGLRDVKTDEALKTFKTERGLGSDPTLNAATRAALTDTLAGRVVSLNTRSGRPTSVTTDGVQVSDKVIAATEQYRSLVDTAASKYGVDSALISGVIAAESGGNKDLVAKSGYTGLMQAGKGEAQKRPAVSIDAGTKKLRDFRLIMEGVLKSRGQRYDLLPEVEQLRLLALAYNAGPVTVAKALQYAAEAGTPERWLDAEHYKRALLFTGAYSLKQAAGSCLKTVSPSERESHMREAMRVWNQWRLGTKNKNWRKLDDPPPWPNVSANLPSFVVCAIDFKHGRSSKYAAKILAYRDRFRLR